MVRTVNTRARDRQRAVALGRELETRVRTGMAEVGIHSVSELAREAHVGRDTLYKLFRGEQAPTHETLVKIAGAIERRPGDLWDYGATIEEDPPDLAGLLAAVNRLVVEMREDRARGQDAAAAILQAAKALAKVPKQ